MLKRKRAADEAAAPAAAAAASSSAEPKSKLQRKEESRDVSRYINKQRTLVLSSRGITHRDRHLLSDLRDLLPHSKKDVKFDAKDDLATINELCEMKNCNNCIFFEARKRKDLYMWISKAPNGPSAKFQVQNSQSRRHTRTAMSCGRRTGGKQAVGRLQQWGAPWGAALLSTSPELWSDLTALRCVV